MKNLIRIAFMLIIISACGNNDSSSNPGPSNLTGKHGNPAISCFTASNAEPICFDPYYSLNQTTGLYNAIFLSDQGVSSSAPITLFFTLTNNETAIFQGTINLNITYFAGTSSTGTYSIAQTVSLSSGESQSFSSILSSPTASSSRGSVFIRIDNSSSNIETSAGIVVFDINPHI